MSLRLSTWRVKVAYAWDVYAGVSRPLGFRALDKSPLRSRTSSGPTQGSADPNLLDSGADLETQEFSPTVSATFSGHLHLALSAKRLVDVNTFVGTSV